MDLNHLPPPTTSPDPYYVSVLALLMGEEPQFRTRSLSQFIGTPDFTKALVAPRSLMVPIVYQYAFGDALPDEAARMVKHELSHQDDSIKLRAASVTVISIASLMVILRMWTRWSTLRKFLLDDIMIALGLAFHIASTVLVLISPEDVRQIWDISFKSVEQALDRAVMVLTFCIFGHLLVQLSLLEMYRNLFPSKLFSYLVITVGAICSVGSLALLIINRMWSNPHPLDLKSMNQEYAIGNACSVFFIVTDFVILAMPIVKVWKLTMPIRTRLAVIGLFSLGALACIFSVLRIEAFNAQAHNPNFTGNALNVGIYTIFEQELGLICACLPALRALARRNAERVKSFLTGSSHSSYSGASIMSPMRDNNDRKPGPFATTKVITTDYSNVVVVTNGPNPGNGNLPIQSNAEATINPKTKLNPAAYPPIPPTPVSPCPTCPLERNRSLRSVMSGRTFRTFRTGRTRAETVLTRGSREVIIGLDMDLEQGIQHQHHHHHHHSDDFTNRPRTTNTVSSNGTLIPETPFIDEAVPMPLKVVKVLGRPQQLPIVKRGGRHDTGSRLLQIIEDYLHIPRTPRSPATNMNSYN